MSFEHFYHVPQGNIGNRVEEVTIVEYIGIMLMALLFEWISGVNLMWVKRRSTEKRP